MSAHQNRRGRMRGMTLIELVVVMLIVGILAAIAIPSYRNYILRVNRTDAKVGLTNAAQSLERCFTRYNAYNNAACTLPVPFTVPLSASAATATYTVNGQINANNFSLTATRVNGQADDTDCGDFVLNETGTQTMNGGTKTAIECWR